MLTNQSEITTVHDLSSSLLTTLYNFTAKGYTTSTYCFDLHGHQTQGNKRTTLWNSLFKRKVGFHSLTDLTIVPVALEVERLDAAE